MTRRKEDDLTPELEAAVEAATDTIMADAPPADEVEPAEGECLLVDKTGAKKTAKLDGPPPRVMADGDSRYERSGETPGGKPVYTEPQT